MKSLIFSLGALLAVTSAAQSATIITMTGDAAASSAPGFSTNIIGTTNDGFAYDPLNPTSVNPALAFNNSLPATYHGAEPAGGTITMAYTLNHVVTAGEPVIVFDIWGRAGNTAWEDRDDDFDVEIFDAGGASLGSVAGLAIADSPAVQYARASFGALAAGTTIADLVITARDSEPASGINNFTVQEVRLAAIPEPSSGLLAGLAGLGLILRRRRK